MKRAQFAVEVVQAVRAAVGPDYPIATRLSQWKMGDYQAKLADSPEQPELLLNALVEAGVDIFHCSVRRFWEPEFAGWVKKLTGKTTITVGSVGMDSDPAEAEAGDHPEGLVERLELGEFDLAAVGRALLGDPAWAVQIREGRQNELQPFTPEAVGTLN